MALIHFIGCRYLPLASNDSSSDLFAVMLLQVARATSCSAFRLVTLLKSAGLFCSFRHFNVGISKQSVPSFWLQCPLRKGISEQVLSPDPFLRLPLYFTFWFAKLIDSTIHTNLLNAKATLGSLMLSTLSYQRLALWDCQYYQWQLYCWVWESSFACVDPSLYVHCYRRCEGKFGWCSSP